MTPKGRLNVTAVALLLGLGVATFLQGAEYRAAMQAWTELPLAAPRQAYLVAGRQSEITGSGKSRRTRYWLQLAAAAPASPAAPRAWRLEVGPSVFERTRAGAAWQARLAGGQARFDPMQSAAEWERYRRTRNLTLGIGAGAALLLALSLTGRLDRWL